MFRTIMLEKDEEESCDYIATNDLHDLLQSLSIQDKNQESAATNHSMFTLSCCKQQYDTEMLRINILHGVENQDLFMVDGKRRITVCINC